MPPDSSATKARILEAAFREFAAHGLAGARVDRIAETAQANKRAIYAYFGNKEELFDIVLAQELKAGVDTIPANWDDLATYSGNLFDYLTADPDRIRLNTWRQLERPQSRPDEVETYRAKIAVYRTAQSPAETLDPVDIFAIAWGITNAWFMAFAAWRDTTGEDAWSPARLAKHRIAVVESVRRILDNP